MWSYLQGRKGGDYLRYLRRKQNITPYPPHLEKMSPLALPSKNKIKIKINKK